MKVGEKLSWAEILERITDIEKKLDIQMDEPPTFVELEQKTIELSRRTAKLEIEKGIRFGTPDNKTLQELATLANESKTYEEYAAKIDAKYPTLKEDTA